MNKPLTLTVLKDVYVTLSTATGPQRVPSTDIEALSSGTQFRIDAAVPLSGFFYVVQIAPDHQVHPDYPSSGSRSVSAGDSLEIPGASTWLTAAIDGPVRAVVTNQPVADGEWPPIDPGRDGDAHTPTGTQGRSQQAGGDIPQSAVAVPPPAPASTPPAKQPSPRK